MLLLSGPPGSGRTSHILAEVRAALRRGATDVRLLTPTATMAEHLRHQLAREGFMLRPNLILTLSHFIAPLVPDTPQISSPALYLLVEDVVRRLNPPEFSRVAHMSGFSVALAQTIDELFTAGAGGGPLGRSAPH